MKKYFISLLVLSFLLPFGINTPAFAEIDPEKLMEILSQLAGTGVNIPTSTGTISTGTTNPFPNPVVTTAPSTKIDHLEISSNARGEVGDLLNLTVQAKTKDGNIASAYRGTIFISIENSESATIPAKDGYSFSSLDQGTKTFSKGLSFSKAGTYIITVSDFSQSNLTANATITISEKVNADPSQPVNPVSYLPNEEVTPANSQSLLPGFKILKVETNDKKATFTFKVLGETSDIRKFEFLYADQEGSSNKIMTFEKERIKNADGAYVWYIPNLALTKYIVSIAGVNSAGDTIPGFISQPFEANLSLSAAGKCIIPNVSGLRVLEKKETSVLYWDNIPEAINYKIYKKNKRGEYVFVKETPNDSYTIYVSNGSIKYEDFSVKAVCSDGTESLKFAPSTSVRTGPIGIVFLGFISGLISWIIIQKRKKIFGKL